MVSRILEDKIRGKLGTGKAILLFGARQLGKTTLLKKIFAAAPATLWLNGDEPDVQALFNNEQQEIDYVEEKDGQLSAWEFKWSATRKVGFPKTFTEKYQPASLQVITPDNFESFLGS